METPIVFAMDDRYAMPTGVAIKSIVNHFSGKYLNFFILYSGKLSPMSKGILCEAIQSDKITINLTYIDVKNVISKASSHIEHISAATYYRIALPVLLSEHDQCLYLDGDIVVTDDIYPLLQIELKSDEYVAGVSTVLIQTARDSVKKERLKKLGIGNFDTYINAGVALLNLKALRDNGCVERMIEMIPHNFPVQDQDILNIVCFDKVKLLHPRYNLTPRISNNDKRAYKVFSKKEIEEANNKPCIIHYADKMKPWRFKGLSKAEEWFRVYDELFANIKLSYNRIPLSEIVKKRAKGMISSFR